MNPATCAKFQPGYLPAANLGSVHTVVCPRSGTASWGWDAAPKVPAVPRAHTGWDVARVQWGHLRPSPDNDSTNHCWHPRFPCSSQQPPFQPGRLWENAPDFSGGAKHHPANRPTTMDGCLASLFLSGPYPTSRISTLPLKTSQQAVLAKLGEKKLYGERKNQMQDVDAKIYIYIYIQILKMTQFWTFRQLHKLSSLQNNFGISLGNQVSGCFQPSLYVHLFTHRVVFLS